MMVSPFLSSTCTFDSVGPLGVGWAMYCVSECGPGWVQARLYSLAEGELVFLLLAALAARLRREPLEFAVERVRG